MIMIELPIIISVLITDHANYSIVFNLAVPSTPFIVAYKINVPPNYFGMLNSADQLLISALVLRNIENQLCKIDDLKKVLRKFRYWVR